MSIGARQSRPSWFRRLAARAGAGELSAFVVPGPEVARARGLDLEATNLRVSDTPRHASVLLLVGELPRGLKKAAAVAYAQMPRPRAILAAGTRDVFPLPEPDASAALGQEDLAAGVAEVRRRLAECAFDPEAVEFDVEAVRTRTEYVCSMHPEVVEEEPGSCPICGMDLVPREATGEEADSVEAEEGSHEEHEAGGADHGSGEHHPHDEAGHEHASQGEEGEGSGTEYTCPMHTEVSRDEPGSCPVCGMDLVPREHAEGEGAEGEMDHGEEPDDEDQGHHEHGDHDDMGFMSMVEMTQDLPRSSDGLQMEWVDASFGPLFPGLPAGLSLTLTLDGDTVAEVEAESSIGERGPAEDLTGPAGAFAERLARLDPLSPVAYRVLALRAVEDAAGVSADEETARWRAGAVERERVASHLGWLATFGHLLGYSWLEERAGRLQLALLRAADVGEVGRLRGEVGKLAHRVRRTPLLRRKLEGIGRLPDVQNASGPAARAAGVERDARGDEESYKDFGFEPVVRNGGDALSRLLVRLEEAERSLELVDEVGSVAVPGLTVGGNISGMGKATIETPRGVATLRVELKGGEVNVVELDAPSAHHMDLVGEVAEGREFGDALVGVASLDISPWGVAR